MEKCVFRFPEIPTHEAGEMIIKGILAEKRIFSVPGHMMPVVDTIRYIRKNITFIKVLNVSYK